MDPKPHAAKLPPGYRLTHSTTGAGKRWEVCRDSDHHLITQNQLTPKLAVDRALMVLQPTEGRQVPVGYHRIHAGNLEIALNLAIDQLKILDAKTSPTFQSTLRRGLEDNLAYLKAKGTLHVVPPGE